MSRKQATIALLLAGVIVLVSTTGMVIAQSQTTCPAGYTAYTVQRGDWIYKIARSFGVTPQAIIAANSPIGGLNPNLIYPGMVLCIPPRPTGAPTATTGPTRTPAPTNTPAPTATAGPTRTPAPTVVIVVPTFRIVAVEKGKTVTIETSNFPANLKFDVRMGAMGTRGVGGTLVTTHDSGAGGKFRATFNIPAGLANADRIAIRLENTATGYFAYNWFYNNTVTVP